jgi:hypothetical protein
MDIIKAALGSTALLGLIAAVIAGVFKLTQQRASNRRSDEQDDALTASQFRAAAEAHVLDYDVPMRQAVLELRAEVNRERQARGQDVREWEPLPKPLPLFPGRNPMG